MSKNTEMPPMKHISESLKRTADFLNKAAVELSNLSMATVSSTRAAGNLSEELMLLSEFMDDRSENEVKWVSLKEEYPDDNIEVMVVDDRSFYFFGFFEDQRFYETASNQELKRDFTHWQNVTDPED